MSSPKTPQSDKRARQKGNLTPKLSDKRLMPRIKEYLSTVHSSRKKHMSAEDIALALQEQYYDYARKKRRPFVQQVEEVCEWLRSKRSEEKISQLENKHLARKYHSQAKQTQQIDNEGSESSTSRGVSTDSEADFEVEFKENPQLQKSANLMNTALQAVYQSKGNVPTPTNSSTGDGSLPCSTSERAQFDSLGSDYPNQTGEPSCEATSTNGHPVLEGHRTTTAVLQGKGTPLSTAVRTGMEEGPFEEVVPVEGSLSESPLQQTVLDKRTAIATPQLPASHVTSIRGNSPRTSLGTLPVGTPGDFAGNSPLNLSMSGFNEQETPTAKEGLVQSCSSLLKSEDQRNSSIICSSRKRLVEEGDKDGADSKIRQKRKKIKDPIVAGQSVGKASSERPQDPDFIPVKSSVRFSDVGGNDDTLKEVCKLLLHLRHPEIYRQLGVSPPQGFLLIGPPGCGKSLLANAIAGELDLPYFRVAATEVVSGISGESEEKLRRLFQVAKESAPCVVFLDEIDAISPKRDTAQREMERRIVSQLLSCMDELSSDCNSGVLVIGATNRPDSIDPALRRAGRFDREVWLGIPNQKAREKILSVLCRGLKLSDEVTLKKLAELSPGFVGADLMALTREAAVHAVERIVTQMSTNRIETTPMGICDVDGPGEGVLSSGSDGKELDEIMRILHTPTAVVPETLDNLSISFDDFQSALVHVQPSAKREGFATVPDVSWEDVGALDNVREELKMAILAPVQFSDQFEALGLSNSPGILLAGPPGCGKTLLAKAIANESRINFLSVKGPELLNMYVGESERAVRQVFQRARNSAPCVIFFDELDALCPKRSEKADSSVSGRVVNQLLTEMDGVSDRKKVFIMAATNRPDIIDPAILRPGRIDKVLYVGLPNVEERAAILKTLTKNGSRPLLSEDVDFRELAGDRRSGMYTGADLSALVREAATVALKEHMEEERKMPWQQPWLGGTDQGGNRSSPVQVCRRHFDAAFEKIHPSVSEKDMVLYKLMERRYGRPGDLAPISGITTHYD